MRLQLATLVLLLLTAPAFAQRIEYPCGWPLPGEPLVVVVHGIRPAPGQLDPLRDHVRARGPRVVTYHYPDSAGLDESARALGEALRRLEDMWPRRRVTILAHSMGGLVSRRALTVGHAARLDRRRERFQLISVASPFGGFRAANFAGLDFGLGPASHDDLGSRAEFITSPGALGERVVHDKLETDEAGRTRRLGGRRVVDDRVALHQQRQATVDAQARERTLLAAGHVGVVSTQGRISAPLAQALTRLLPRAQPAGEPTSTHAAWANGMSDALGAPLRAKTVGWPGANGVEAVGPDLRAARLRFRSPTAARRWADLALGRTRGLPMLIEARGDEAVLIEGDVLRDEATGERALAAAWEVFGGAGEDARTVLGVHGGIGVAVRTTETRPARWPRPFPSGEVIRRELAEGTGRASGWRLRPSSEGYRLFGRRHRSVEVQRGEGHRTLIYARAPVTALRVELYLERLLGEGDAPARDGQRRGLLRVGELTAGP